MNITDESIELENFSAICSDSVRTPSVWPEENLLTCFIASSSFSTIFIAILRSKNSVE